ncbi:ATP-binding protein [Agrobacterium rubi]|nr:ATP-binding protein [Agrobacterium rubi]NTF25034.1 ATP-binding protein [Agrobacterium rubi]
MNAIVRMGAGSHAPEKNTPAPKKNSFKHAFPEIFGKNDAAYDWDIRPVLVLSTKQQGNRVGTWHPEQKSEFVEELNRLGYVGSQCNEIELDAYPLDYAWPRNMEWKTLPVLSAPKFRHHFILVMPLDDDGAYANANETQWIEYGPELDTELQKLHVCIGTGVELVVVAAQVLHDHDLRSATAAYDSASGDRPRFVHFDGEKFREITESEISRVRRRYLPQERFIYNHAVNMNVMASRALMSISRERRWTRRLAQQFLPSFTHMAWDFGHPLVLQMLFAIRKSGRSVPDATVTALHKLQYGQEPLVLARGLPFTWQNGDRFDFVWTGSGKYPKFVQDLGVISEETARVGTVQMARAGDELFQLCRNLIRWGFIDLDGSRVAITHTGERFLDMIGNEADDPDVILRWRAASGEMVTDDHVEDMDRWCNRVFRAMKRKVADLPASAMVENTGAQWNLEPSNTVAIRGVVIPVSDEDLSNPKFVQFLRAADEEQRSAGLHDMRRGVLTEAQPLDGEARVIALWIGIPIAIIDSLGAAHHAADLFKDMTAIDAECKAIIDAVAAEIPGTALARRKIATISAFGTSEKVGPIRDLPDELVVEEGDVVADVIAGNVLCTERKADDPVELATMYESQLRMKDPNGIEIVTGLRCYGDGKPRITFSFGFLVGRRNTRTGQTVHRTTIPRKDFASLERWRSGGGMREILGHPDLSEKGVWYVFPDGCVEKQRSKRKGVVDVKAEPEPEPAVVAVAPVVESVVPELSEQNEPSQEEIDEVMAAHGKPEATITSTPSARRGIVEKANPAVAILERIYKEEWLRIVDKNGFLAQARRRPMMIGSFLGVPENHADFVQAEFGLGKDEKPVCRLVTITKPRKKKTESEYAQELRSLLADGNSVVFVTNDETHVPSIFSANGPVFEPQYNAFEVAARVLLRLEAELEEKGEKALEISYGSDAVSNIDLAVRRDGSVLIDGTWEKIVVPAKFIGGVFNALRRAAKDGHLNIEAFAAMRFWADRAKIKGVSNGEGPESLKDIPGIGRVRKRLEALYSKMEGNGSKVGIIFHGPPGTGKTMLARTLARDTGRHFVLGSFAEWQSSGTGHLGDMLNAMKATFAEAKANQPAMLFIDEMDSLGDRRKLAGNGKEYMTAVINAFIEHVQGFHSRGDVVVVGATNDISRLDPAITRSGRLGEHVKIGLPDRQEIGEIVRWYMNEASKRIAVGADIDCERISDLLDGSSPADIGAVVDNAVNNAAFEESALTVAHVLHSINTAAGTTMDAASSEFFCVHEAARLTALHLMGDIGQSVACARSRPGVSNGTGIVVNTQIGGAMSSDLVRLLKFNLAGMAAASLEISGAADIGSIARPCIDQARIIARELVSMGMAAGNRIAFVAMSNGAQLDQAVTDWLEWGYKEAVCLLAPHKAAILRLAAEIRAREHMGAEEVIDVLGDVRPQEHPTTPL